jgi:hypothetical protein
MASAVPKLDQQGDSARRIKKLRYVRDRISESDGMREGDALTRSFLELHH